MSYENVEEEQQQDLSMSDEDFLNMAAPVFNATSEELDTSDESEDLSDDSDDGSNLEEETLQEEEQGTDESEGEEEDEVNEDDLSSEDSQESDDADLDEEGESDEVDYEALHKQLLQPFNANGTQMSVNSVEEAHKLMQMGANYSKKMSALKPNLKLMKMLDNNELLDEGKLSLLIDAAQGNPEAISQLVRDNNVDPLTLKTDEENKYTPKKHTVGDNQVELDEVLSRIQDTDTFADTMDVVSSKWDESSKSDIASNPHALEILNNQMSNGVYATIDAEVQRIKVFGGLQGVSDFDAYKQVGDQLFTAGKITMDGVAKPKEKVVVKTAPKAKPSNKTRTDKRKAASPVKNSGTKKPVKSEFDPLSMSDEEFENFKF